MPPKSRSQSAKNQRTTQVPGQKKEAKTIESKPTAESIGAIKMASRKKRTINQQQDELKEAITELKIQAPQQPVNLNEQKKRVRVEEPLPTEKLKPVPKSKHISANPQVPDKPALRKSKSTQKIQLPEYDESIPKPVVRSKSQVKNKSTEKEPKKGGKQTNAKQKPNVQAADVQPAKQNKSKKAKYVSETESDGPLSEYFVNVEALQSIGWQSPSSSLFKQKQKLKIVYPNLVIKNTKSQRMSLLDSTNATQDEKEMRQIKYNLRQTDKDFKDWEDAWKKLRIDTKKLMSEKQNKSWDNFKKMYDQRKKEIFNQK